MIPGCGTVDVETEVQFGHTVLHWALQKCAYECDDEKARMERKAEVAKVLIEHGADADALSATGESPWHMIALSEELVSCAEDLSVYGQMIRDPDFPVGDLLCLSADNGNVALIAFLRLKKFDIDTPDKEKRTALFCAAAAGHNDVVQFLGEKGANLAATSGTEQQTPLHAAAFNNHLKCVKALAQLKANLEATEAAGQRPLHIAAKCGHLEVVQMLLSLKVEVDPLDQIGRTPYTLAAEAGHREIAAVLSKAGACVSS